jgi:hypothetical protein
MIERKDVEAALEARRELGKEYEPDLIASFLARIDSELAERRRPAPAERETGHHGGAITPIILGTTAMGIPITAIATSNGGAGGIVVAIVAWGAIGLSNVTIALLRYRR